MPGLQNSVQHLVGGHLFPSYLLVEQPKSPLFLILPLLELCISHFSPHQFPSHPGTPWTQEPSQWKEHRFSVSVHLTSLPQHVFAVLSHFFPPCLHKPFCNWLLHSSSDLLLGVFFLLPQCKYHYVLLPNCSQKDHFQTAIKRLQSLENLH